MDASQILVRNIDKTQLPPLHQKRVLAFVNHFIINSCNFLNEFAVQCETKFIELERKLQHVEATLVILEAKLNSIPSADEEVNVKIDETSPESDQIKDAVTVIEPEKIDEPIATEVTTIKVCEGKYKKYFKMLQVGVPIEAVKIKMTLEGLDPNILDCPNEPTTQAQKQKQS